MNTDLIYLPEPTLTFRFDQDMEDPRDGLTIFGPLDEAPPIGIRCGVIGTVKGIKLFRKWLTTIQRAQWVPGSEISRPPFAGFDATFRAKLAATPYHEITIPEELIRSSVRLDDRYQRVFTTVSLYADRLLDVLSKEETAVDVWFVVVPEEVHTFCKPRSTVQVHEQIQAPYTMSPRAGKALRTQPSMFIEQNKAAIPYQYDPDFRNQLKARLLPRRVITQVVRERILAGTEADDLNRSETKAMAKSSSAIAWNLSTALFYKAGGRPWKTHNVRDGVCYIGLTFKANSATGDPGTSCCAAQMFLDSGDGVVFKGALGPWFRQKEGEFHLTREAAEELLSTAISAYRTTWNRNPRELFLHGKVRFNREEWSGFQSGVPSDVSLVGVHIRPSGGLKLFRKSEYPVLRGLAAHTSPRQAYLWTNGYVPRLKTYPGREVPNPLRVDVTHGEADVATVLSDILALTKLNYNTCVFADGLPVTLKFADAVGEILTAGPVEDVPPLPFKHYI